MLHVCGKVGSGTSRGPGPRPRRSGRCRRRGAPGASSTTCGVMASSSPMRIHTGMRSARASSAPAARRPRAPARRLSWAAYAVAHPEVGPLRQPARPVDPSPERRSTWRRRRIVGREHGRRDRGEATRPAVGEGQVGRGDHARAHPDDEETEVGHPLAEPRQRVVHRRPLVGGVGFVALAVARVDRSGTSPRRARPTPAPDTGPDLIGPGVAWKPRAVQDHGRGRRTTPSVSLTTPPSTPAVVGISTGWSVVTPALAVPACFSHPSRGDEQGAVVLEGSTPPAARHGTDRDPVGCRVAPASVWRTITARSGNVRSALDVHPAASGRRIASGSGWANAHPGTPVTPRRRSGARRCPMSAKYAAGSSTGSASRTAGAWRVQHVRGQHRVRWRRSGCRPATTVRRRRRAPRRSRRGTCRSGGRTSPPVDRLRCPRSRAIRRRARCPRDRSRPGPVDGTTGGVACPPCPTTGRPATAAARSRGGSGGRATHREGPARIESRRPPGGPDRRRDATRSPNHFPWQNATGRHP